MRKQQTIENKKTKMALDIDENIEGLLCYVLGWITGIVFLALEKDNKFVRFHAMQSLAVFLPLNVIAVVVGIDQFVGWAIVIIYLVPLVFLWVLLMFKAFMGKKFKIPIIGKYAEQQINR